MDYQIIDSMSWEQELDQWKNIYFEPILLNDLVYPFTNESFSPACEMDKQYIENDRLND